MEYANSEIKSLICEYIHNSRNRKILYRRMVDGMTFEALAVEFNMSVRQVKTIVYRETQVLFKHLSY